MKILYSNIMNTDGDALCITTNGIVKKDGSLVMGTGSAKAFADEYPNSPNILGEKVKRHGNRVFFILRDDKDYYSFPTKHNWREDSNINLITKSADELVKIVNEKGYKDMFATSDINQARAIAEILSSYVKGESI